MVNGEEIERLVEPLFGEPGEDFLGRQRFNGSVGSYRHKCRRIDYAALDNKPATSSIGVRSINVKLHPPSTPQAETNIASP